MGLARGAGRMAAVTFWTTFSRRRYANFCEQYVKRTDTNHLHALDCIIWSFPSLLLHFCSFIRLVVPPVDPRAPRLLLSRRTISNSCIINSSSNTFFNSSNTSTSKCSNAQLFHPPPPHQTRPATSMLRSQRWPHPRRAHSVEVPCRQLRVALPTVPVANRQWRIRLRLSSRNRATDHVSREYFLSLRSEGRLY